MLDPAQPLEYETGLFIDWFKFETRPSSLRNSGMAYNETIA